MLFECMGTNRCASDSERDITHDSYRGIQAPTLPVKFWGPFDFYSQAPVVQPNGHGVPSEVHLHRLVGQRGK